MVEVGEVEVSSKKCQRANVEERVDFRPVLFCVSLIVTCFDDWLAGLALTGVTYATHYALR